MSIPRYKDIMELIKAGATLQAQEKIIELRQAALDIQEENVVLREKVAGLKARVRELESLEGEPCLRCRKRAWHVSKSEPDKTFGQLGGIRRTYICDECGLEESILLE